METLIALTREVCTYYKDDKSYPSIVTSELVKKELYYVSIVRYHEHQGQGKEVILKSTGVSLAGCYKQLLDDFRALIRGRDETQLVEGV